MPLKQLPCMSTLECSSAYLFHFCLNFEEAFIFLCAKCRLFELCVEEKSMKLLPREAPSLQGVGLQTCIEFSVDGCKLGVGGEVRRLQLYGL